MICIGFQTAKDYWREARREVAKSNPPQLLVHMLFDDDFIPDISALPVHDSSLEVPSHVSSRQLNIAARYEPLLFKTGEEREVLVSSRGGRKECHGMRTHLCSSPRLAGHLCKAPSGLLVPDLTLLSLELAVSQEVDDLALIEFLCECCGYFVPSEEVDGGMLATPPLTSVCELRDSLLALAESARAAGERLPRGLKRVLRLLDNVLDGAASPGEVRLALLLSLPRELGGYGLPKPRMNVMVKEGQVGDLTWGDRLVLDYHGTEAHKSPKRHVSDSRKRNAMVHSGYEYLVAEKDMLKSRDDCDELAQMIAEHLGVELGPNDSKWGTLHLNLRRKLLGPWVA